MGPIEIVFIVVWAIFGLIGLVRGVWRELGVTTMMLIALLLVQLLTTQFGARWDAVLGLLILDSSTHFVVKNLLALAFTVVMAFISYQGETFNFPGKGNNWFFSLGAGLLNGYLLAGSAWYYLQAACWPGGLVGGPFTDFYQVMMKLLPPAVLSWQILILLVVFMMIMRVIK